MNLIFRIHGAFDLVNNLDNSYYTLLLYLRLGVVTRAPINLEF